MSAAPRPPGPPPGPPPVGPPPSGGGQARSGSSLRVVLAVGLVIVVVVAVVLGVLLVGGSEAQGETVQLESTTARGSNPFMPSVVPAGTTPSTLAPASGSGPFGGTGDNTLCDRDRMIAFLTDAAHDAQAREWARVVGITVAEIPTYVADLVPTLLASDTAVTNNSFVGGRVVPYQAVLQAGTAVLVDTRGTPIARCESGNPLGAARQIANPVYTGPRWPRFDPRVIVIIVPSGTRVFTPGGDDEPDDFDIEVTARAANVDSTDSVITVAWAGTVEVDDDALTGTGRGTLTFSGNCFVFEDRVSDLQFDATFDVAITGNAAGRRPDRTYSLTFVPSAPTIGAINGANLTEECRAVVPVFAASLVTQALGPLTIPAARGSTPATSGPFNLVVTIS